MALQIVGLLAFLDAEDLVHCDWKSDQVWLCVCVSDRQTDTHTHEPLAEYKLTHVYTHFDRVGAVCGGHERDGEAR